MSNINNEALYETIYEEFMEELTLTDTLHKYSEKEILKICNQRFEDYIQWLKSIFHPLIIVSLIIK